MLFSHTGQTGAFLCVMSPALLQFCLVLLSETFHRDWLHCSILCVCVCVRFLGERPDSRLWNVVQASLYVLLIPQQSQRRLSERSSRTPTHGQSMTDLEHTDCNLVGKYRCAGIRIYPSTCLLRGFIAMQKKKKAFADFVRDSSIKVRNNRKSEHYLQLRQQ